MDLCEAMGGGDEAGRGEGGRRAGVKKGRM